MKIGTQTNWNMLSPKNSKPEVCRHFCKMAAASISKIVETVNISHLSSDFDEIWYTD
jgi:hypothetical protein